MVSRPKYFERLLLFLRRKGRSREDAEDLIQEAMLRLHLYGREVAVTNEEAFLRHTVHNLAIDQHRRDRPDLRRGVPIEDVNAQSPLVDPDSTPEQTLDAQQRLGHIRCVLDAVSRRTRDIYFAHRAGYSYVEIAEAMDISHITIKRHIARALLAIMEDGEPDDDIPNGAAE
jgi:RNA polymerase sigma-70 factor (ECF subfamily)